jgi:hypothetical protein
MGRSAKLTYQHFEQLDILALVNRFGGQMLPKDLEPLLRCQQCDRKCGEITIHEPGC